MPSRALSFSSTRVPPGRRAARVALTVLVACAIVVLVWGAVLATLWGYATFRLGADELPALAVEDADDVADLGPAGASAPAQARTVLVTMTGPVDPTVPRPSALLGPVVLVQIGGPREEPAVLSLPGELVVTVDGAGDLTLADVQAQGGTDLLLRAVADYSEVRIDHAVSFSVDALPDLLDVVGPIELCDDAGCRPVTGDRLETRLGTAGDRELVTLVSETLRGLGEWIDGTFVVLHPLRSKRLVDVVDVELATDVALRGARLLELAAAFEGMGPLDADTVPLVVNPVTGEIVPLVEPAMVRFQHLREGTPLGGSGDDPTAAMEADLVGSVEVAILNGAGVDGLAGRVAAELETAGFRVVGTGNAPSFDRTDTVVHHLADEPTIAFAAAQLSEALGGAVIEPLGQRPEFEGDEVDLLVTVGEDRTG